MIHQPFKFFPFLFSVLFPICILSQEQIEYKIDGNYLRNDQFYIDCIVSANPLNSNTVENIILERLSIEGIFLGSIKDFRIDTLSGDKITYYLEIDEGKETYIRSINFDSSSLKDSVMGFTQFEYLNGNIFIQSEIENSILDLITDFENNGFPFTEVSIRSVRFDLDEDSNSVVDLFIEINKGSERRIDKVEINGNDKTKDYVILNAVRLSKGVLYSQGKD